MRGGRVPLVPLVLTVVCAAGIVTAATAASGAPAPVPVAQQGGHWVVNRAASAALHVHGGTAQVDARVDLPPDGAGEGLAAVAGGPEGFVVGRDRVWTFDRSTLTVVADAGSAASEVPVPIEVVGGPYLVYRQAGTVARLGAPPVVLDAGGPLGSPVRTPAGTVAVQRTDTGAVCGLPRDALELDCAISAPPGSRGGLTAVGGTVVFVDTGSDAAYRVLFGAGLDGGTRLGTDLPDDALLGDRAVGDRLPVVLPGSNVLRLVDVGGLAALRPGAEPVDVPLGEGAFSAPVVGESAIALLELTSGRLITFAPDGTRTGEAELPPGSTADALARGEDGRLYLDEPGGGRVHVVQPGGSVDTVEIGNGRGPAIAVAPPPEQLAPVRPPLPGQAVVPPDVLAQPVGAPVGGAVVAVPGPGGPPLALPGPGPGPGDGDPIPGPLPDPQQQPPDAVPPGAEPGAPVVPQDPELPEEPAVTGELGAPTALTARRVDDDGDLSIVVEWAPPAGGPAPTAYRIDFDGTIDSGSETVTGLQFVDPGNYCSPQPRYTVWSVDAAGELGASVDFALGQVNCAAETEIASAEATADGTLTVTVRCSTTPDRPVRPATLTVIVSFEEVGSATCEMPRGVTEELHTFTRTGLVPGRSYTVSAETYNGVGFHESDPVTVTVP